jgi:hypothetical protein
MKIYKTELEEEYYILTPRNIGGELTQGIQVSYPDELGIETFSNLEDYESRCLELGIKIDEI